MKMLLDKQPRRYSPGTLDSGRGGMPPCGSVAPVPASLPRLLWLPERWLGGRAGPILGDSIPPPARRPCVSGDGDALNSAQQKAGQIFSGIVGGKYGLSACLAAPAHTPTCCSQTSVSVD